MISEADYLLRQWAIWSLNDGIIPKKLFELSPNWHREIPSDYPEEPHTSHCDEDDETMGVVDRVVAELGRTKPKAYVVILDVYRNQRSYHKTVEEEALADFCRLYAARPSQKVRLYA